MRLKRTPKERRDTQRSSVAWDGRFGRGGQPEWEWQACTVEDVSGGGARLATTHPCPVRSGDAITISIDRLGDTSVGLRLRGRVAYVTGASGERVAVGVALDFETPHVRRIAESLFVAS